MNNETPQFPNYQTEAQLPTNHGGIVPPGVQMADPKYHKPLYKMMKKLMTKRVKPMPKRKKTRIV